MSNKQAAIEIVERLQQQGFDALLAGGCVRDMLLGRPAKDYDVATSARPDDVIRLFRRTLKVGAKFGVVIVLTDGQQVEVATFRCEAGYADGRHPSEVRFTTAAEDASRRDFTINGMFYDPLKEQVIDYVGGQADLKKGIIRTIGEPDERFDEDYLRMLRAIRFSTQLAFPMEPQTYSAIGRNASNIVKISGERIAVELEGILTHPNRARGAAMLVETGLAEAIFPSFAGDRAARGVAVLAGLRKKVEFPPDLAALFADCPTDFEMERTDVLKMRRKHIKHMNFLQSHRGRLLQWDMPLSRLKKLLAEAHFWDLYELERAIQKATVADKGLTPLIKLRKRIRALAGADVKPKPLLDGHDLMHLGAVPGPVLGRLIEELYGAQLEGEVRTREQAHQWARSWLQEHPPSK